jgi:DNA-binding NarL/FixJ family response regulator
MRVVIAEDEPLLREGMAMVLGARGFEIAAAVGDADALREAVDTEQPDVVVTDIRMPPDHTDDGLRAAVELRRTRPEVGIIVLSAHVVQAYARALFQQRPTGAGYLLKHRITDVATFCQDIRRVGEGGTVLDPEVVAVLMARPAADDGLRRLTARQREVLGLIAEGRSNAAIAAKLSITEKAVARHASLMYDALGIAENLEDHRRVLAVLHLLNRSTPPTDFPAAPSSR